MSQKIKYTKFIPTECFDEASGEWEKISEENGYKCSIENWLKDKAWVSDVIYIKKLTDDIIIVGSDIYYKDYNFNTSEIELYKGLLE